MSRNLTEKQAMAVYRKFVKAFGGPYDAVAADHVVEQGTNDPAWGKGPVLVRNFQTMYSDVRWAIVWEGGPYDWPQLFPHGGRDEEFGSRWPEVKLASNVFVEAINGYSVGLYLDEW